MVHDRDETVLEAFDQFAERHGIVVPDPEHQPDVRIAESHLGAGLSDRHSDPERRQPEELTTESQRTQRKQKTREELNGVYFCVLSSSVFSVSLWLASASTFLRNCPQA